LSVHGVPGALLTQPEEGLGPATKLGLTVGADNVGTFRILVTGNPAHLEHGAKELEFTLRNPVTGEKSEYESTFLGPAGTRR